jgi:hypothetical protein
MALTMLANSGHTSSALAVEETRVSNMRMAVCFIAGFLG